MLAITRRIGDSTIINNDTAVRVISIKGYLAKLDVYSYHLAKGAAHPVVKWLRRIEVGASELTSVLPDVKLCINRVNRAHIRLCCDAPATIPIHREEVHRRIVNGER